MRVPAVHHRAWFALVLLVSLLAAGCDQDPTVIEYGEFVVRVVDQNGAPVFNALVEATYADGSRALGGGTDVTGLYSERVLYGRPLTVRVTPPAGYTVPGTQQNPVSFTAAQGNTRLVFTLNKTAP